MSALERAESLEAELSATVEEPRFMTEIFRLESR
jgi:hypothetical protein